MFLSDFDYELPPELIARYPLPARSSSRMLRVGDSLQDALFADLTDFLRPADVLVFNNTRVIPARLHGTKDTGGKVELLIERVLSDNEALAHVKASKTPRIGAQLNFPAGIYATVIARQSDFFHLRFSQNLSDYLELHGSIPLPPYLHREAESADGERYQTVYADPPGAVAAPTAGLHFDSRMLAAIDKVGVKSAYVTLHVAAGTFQPLREEQVSANRLHAEQVEVTESVCDTIRTAQAEGGRVIAVGTTTVRALETATAGGDLAAFYGETELFIQPGYKFRSVDAMLTNFHLPKSSLLMLVAAFAGHKRIMAAYRHAVQQRYRFFSYGDAMLLMSGQE